LLFVATCEQITSTDTGEKYRQTYG